MGIAGMILAAAVASAAPQQNNALERVALADGVEKICRNTVLSNQELTVAIIGAAAGSMTELCECTAMLTVSAMTDEQVALARRDLKEASKVSNEITKNLPRCTQMAPFK